MDPKQVVGSTDDVVLLDVREPQEWSQGRIDGALHVPMYELAARQDELPTDRRIVCVCRSGSRSAAVTSALTAAGYNAVNLEGGLLAWVEAGYELVDDSGGSGRIS